MQWNLPVDIDAWITSVGCQTSASGNGKHLMEIHDLQNIVAKLRVAMPDAIELSCAKAIALFKPGNFLCHESSKLVERSFTPREITEF